MSPSFQIALTTVFTVFCIIASGFYLRRSGQIKEEHDAALLQLVVNLLLPCLIFDRIIKTDAFENWQNCVLPPILGFLSVGVGILIALAIAAIPMKWSGLKSWRERRTFAACVGAHNYGFVPYPLILALYPANDRLVSVLFVQNLGTEFAMWTILIFCIMGRFDKASLKRAINGPTITIPIVMTLNLVGHSELLPDSFFVSVTPYFDFFLDAVHMLGQAAFPISILMVGATFADFAHWSTMRLRVTKSLRISFWSCFVRLFLLPPLFLVVAVFLPVTQEIKQVLVIHGATSSAIFSIVLTKHYDGNTEVGFDSIMSNMVVSILTLPAWTALGLSLVTPYAP